MAKWKVLSLVYLLEKGHTGHKRQTLFGMYHRLLDKCQRLLYSVHVLNYWIIKIQVACVAGQLMKLLDKSQDYCWLSVKVSEQDLHIIG